MFLLWLAYGRVILGPVPALRPKLKRSYCAACACRLSACGAAPYGPLLMLLLRDVFQSRGPAGRWKPP